MSDTTRQSLLTGLGSIIAFFLANYFVFEDSYWAIISVVILFTDFNTHPFHKGILRISGTFFGAMGGLLIFNMCSVNALIYSITVLGCMTLFTYKSYTSKHHYAWFLASLTFYMVMMVGVLKPDAMASFAYWRCLEIMLGVIIAMALSFLLPTLKISASEKQINYPVLRSVKASISCLVSIWLLLYLDWYDAVVGVISTQLISFEVLHQKAINKSIQRITGCLLGAACGLGYLFFLPQNILTLSLMLFTCLSAFCALQKTLPNYSYLFLQATLALCVAITGTDNQISQNIAPALERTAGIFLGVSVGLLVNISLWPKVHQEVNEPTLTHPNLEPKS